MVSCWPRPPKPLPEKRQHEIGFYFLMESPPADLPRRTFAVLDNAETSFEWVPLAEVETRPVYPLAVAELLKVPAGQLLHRVQRS